MIFGDFSKENFVENLNIEAKRLGKKLKDIAAETGVPIYLYSQSEPKIPRADTLFKLAKIGMDINFLLTGQHAYSLVEQILGGMYVKEKKSDYLAKEDRLDKLENRLNDIEKQNSELINFCASLIDILKQNISDKDELIQRLSVQFVTLVAANQTKDNLNSGNNIIK